MSALLTYRSRNSFESRFGRKFHDPEKHPTITHSPKIKPSTPAEASLLIHNDGHRNENFLSKTSSLSKNNDVGDDIEKIDAKELSEINDIEHSVPTVFSAQNYLRYQGDKFIKRFDSNCYISLTRKMD